MKNFVIKGLYIIAWIIFVGLSIEGCGLLVNFIVSIFKPDFVGNLYQKLDLLHIYSSNKGVFFGIYSFILVIAFLKTLLFYRVIQLSGSLELEKPFSQYVSKKIEQISIYTFEIGIISYIGRVVVKGLSGRGYDLEKLGGFWVDSDAFILMAAIIFIISVIFKKGLEMQNENELTI